MEKRPIIGVTFWNSYPAGLPGQLGALTNTELRFLDLDGRLAPAIQASSATHRKVSALSLEALKATGFRLRFLQIREGRLKDQETRLQQKVHLMVRKLLRRTSHTTLQLEVSWCADPLRPVEHRHEKHRLMEKMESAKPVHFYIIQERGQSA